MKKIAVVLSLLFLLVCPVLGNEESEVNYLEQLNVTVVYGSEITVSEANCAALATDSLFQITQQGLYARVTLVRSEAGLILGFTVTDQEHVQDLIEFCPDFHRLSFPGEDLTICTLDTSGNNATRIYSSYEEVSASE